jgi:hypothetical protein
MWTERHRMETTIDVRSTGKQFDPEECQFCTAEAEAAIETDTTQYRTVIFMCPFHLEMLVERAQEWLGGEG